MPLVPPRHSRRLVSVVLIASCARASAVESPASPAPSPASPWSRPALSASAIPSTYLDVWRRAENRGRCALIAPETLDPPLPRSAQPRPATFSGGWAVAYDLPEARSAFGVAGTGTSAWNPSLYQDWPYKRIYADSSRVGYGLEGGGAGPNWLAYVQIPGQDCLYNVWSRQGREELEALLARLRFVRGS